MAKHLRSIDDVAAPLKRARTIAVLGAHPDAVRPAHYVPAYLKGAGYRIIPVNPRFVGQTLWGEVVRATLAEIQEPIDIVDVFRPSEALPTHIDDVLAMRPLPALLWLQQGIENDAIGEQVMARGIDFVQDRCTLADHRRLGLAPIGSTP